ncbi:MAG: serine/threonine-protein kinase [Acidobacteriota bacterium]
MKQCPVCKQEFKAGIIFCPTDGEKLLTVDEDDPLVGELIDNKYLIEEKVAVGSTATIYRATHVQLELHVALKVMHPHLTLDKTAVERFRREAFAAMQIRHPNAIAVLDFAVTTNGLVYVVTELLSGVTLRRRIFEQYPYSLSEINEIMQQICAAVAVAHSREIIHRDLKPDNIFLDNDRGQEIVKVLDFGIAKLNEITDLHEETSPRLTRQGFVLGTPHYMSPEQCHGKELDVRSDIYSLGVMLYELLTGHVPFNGRSYAAIALKKVREKPKSIHEIRKDIPPVVNAVVMHALAKNPEERPESVQHFARELEIAVRAVTEHEFFKVFQSVSDQELEATILLAGDPGRPLVARITGNLNKAKKTTGRFNSPNELGLDSKTKSTTSGKLASDVATIDPPSKEISDRSAVLASTATLKHEAIQDNEKGVVAQENSLVATPTPEKASKFPVNLMLPSPPIEHYGELLQFANDAPQLLRQEMLSLTRELAMLLQIVINDLEGDIPFDRLFFTELRSCLDALRAVMYHLQQIYDHPPTPPA